MSETKKIKRIAFLTSGGDAPGMNACIRSVVRSCIYHDVTPVGVMRGFDGLLSQAFEEFNARSVANIIQRGGTAIMASRSKAFLLPEQRAAAYLNLKRAKIDALIGIGGDGTLRGLQVFSKEHRFPVCGIPGTIDNDLGGTDFSIGFDTAINTALEMVDRLRDTAASYDRVMIVEVMGRDSGQIALDVALACGAEAALIPETKTDLDQLVENLKASHARGKHSQIIIVAEGDDAGDSMDIAKHLEEKLSIPVRATILGHVQRGGTPSARDRILASLLGSGAVSQLMQGQAGFMAGVVNGQLVFPSIDDVLQEKKTVPQNLVELMTVLAK